MYERQTFRYTGSSLPMDVFRVHDEWKLTLVIEAIQIQLAVETLTADIDSPNISR